MLFLIFLLFLARSYRDVQHTNFRMSLKIDVQQMCHILLYWHLFFTLLNK